MPVTILCGLNGERVRRRMRRLGLNYSGLAERAGLSGSWLRRALNGEAIGVAAGAKIAEALGYPLERILLPEEED